jgi:hypothetical protein
VKAEFVSRFQSAHNPRFVSAAVGGLSVVLFAAVRIVANGTKQTSRHVLFSVAMRWKADMVPDLGPTDVAYREFPSLY